MSSDSNNPYQTLPKRNFWRSAVAEPGPHRISDLHNAKFSISPSDRIVTFGSCFAQTLSKALARKGYTWYDAEPAPPMMSKASATAFNYGVFSARTGNIYTVALLRQWLDWAFDPHTMSDEFWEVDGSVMDPVRTAIEPGGFTDRDEFIAARRRTLHAIRNAMSNAQVFIFTLGLTEMWRNTETGLVYSMCPGTHGGAFDPSKHKMTNLMHRDIMSDLEAVADRLMSANPDLKIILTVSPVSLTATAEPDCHALVANTYTKSTLRSVAGEASRIWANIDYFPSYELVATPAMRGMFYAPNMRTIEQPGVDIVMRAFFESYTAPSSATPMREDPGVPQGADDVICDEMILDYYNAS